MTPMVLHEDEVIAEISMEKIVFINKSPNTVIGEALKSNIIEQNDWEELVKQVNSLVSTDL